MVNIEFNMCSSNRYFAQLIYRLMKKPNTDYSWSRRIARRSFRSCGSSRDETTWRNVAETKWRIWNRRSGKRSITSGTKSTSSLVDIGWIYILGKCVGVFRDSGATSCAPVRSKFSDIFNGRSGQLPRQNRTLEGGVLYLYMYIYVYFQKLCSAYLCNCHFYFLIQHKACSTCISPVFCTIYCLHCILSFSTPDYCYPLFSLHTKLSISACTVI